MAADETLRSRANPLYKRLLALRRHAAAEGELCLLEGPKLVLEAVAAGVVLVEAAFAPRAGATEPGRAALAALAARGVPARAMSPELVASLSEAEASQGLVALGRRPAFEEAAILGGTPLVLVADAVQNPGNLGGLLRTAEAAGATGAYLTGACADPLSWKALRGSMGSAFRLPHVRGLALEAVVERLLARGIAVLATAADGVKMVTGHTATEDEKNMAGVITFASQIAHHFNNILSVVSGYGGLLKTRMSEDDPALAYVEKMLASSLRAHDLVRSLFLFTGDEKSRLREVDLNRVLKRAARFLSQDEEDGIDVRMELHENSLAVVADVVKMEEVLVNLIENARDAMPRGGVLTLATEGARSKDGHRAFALENEPGYAYFSVTDTGIGMDEETKEKMFDPFFTTKGPGKSMGLGLSKVYGIVKQHSGEISVQSTQGKGTSVKIRMPLVKSGFTMSEPIPLPDSIIAGRVPLCSECWRS